MRTIQIRGKEYQIRYTIRALFIWEQITGKPFKINTLLDNYIFFYSMILASNKNDIINWDDFIDALDADPTLFKRMSDIVAEQNKKDDLFNADNSSDGDEKKS